MMNKVAAFFILMSLSSCITINGLTNDYNKLPTESKQLIVPYSPTDSLLLDHIYTINGDQLLTELKQHPKVLVYLFTNACKSTVCYPLEWVEKKAKSKGYKLFLIMNGYANLSETLNQVRTTPLFAIDNNFYNINYRNKYITVFLVDLLKQEDKAKQLIQSNYGSFFLFNDGKLSEISDDIK